VFNYYLFTHQKTIFHTKILNSKKKTSEYATEEYIHVLDVKPSVIFVTLQYFFLFIVPDRDKNNSIIILTYSKSRWLHWWLYPVLNLLTGLKYIIIIHGGGLTKWDWPFIHKLLFKKASEIIGISWRICNEYKNRTTRNLKYIPPIIPFSINKRIKYDAKKKFAIEATEKVVIAVGSIKPLKNPQTIIEAIDILGANFIRNNALKFIFAGDGILRAELEKSVKQSDSGKKYIFFRQY
jgi:glycosyltransferase involved in cell wall biosynthesis